MLQQELKEQIDETVNGLIKIHRAFGSRIACLTAMYECNRIQAVKVANYIRFNYPEFIVTIVRPDLHFDSTTSGRWETVPEDDYEIVLPTIFEIRFK